MVVRLGRILDHLIGGTSSRLHILSRNAGTEARITRTGNAMRAVILAGGEGTRLRPYTTVLPKPLMPIGDRPVLDIVVRQLKDHGFERITIATGYLAELIEAFFRDGAGYGIPIDYFREQEPLGTVGALAMIEGLADEDFLVMNGDVLTDIDYAALLRHHHASDAAATIATKEREIQVSLGVLRFGDGGDPTRLTGYDEKPVIDYVASMGVYCFAPRALTHINSGERLDFPDLILRLIAAGEVVRAWPSTDYWLDIGRHDDYEQAQEEFETVRHRLIPGEGG
jgi:NDP-mannose synthase